MMRDLYADFHALRHSYISLLAAGGVHPKIAQSLARHSDIKLTMNRYTHTVISDEAEALEVLPDFPSAFDGNDESGHQELKATGTDDLAPEKCTPQNTPKLVSSDCISLPLDALSEGKETIPFVAQPKDEKARKPLENEGLQALGKAERGGFEPPVPSPVHRFSRPEHALTLSLPRKSGNPVRNGSCGIINNFHATFGKSQERLHTLLHKLFPTSHNPLPQIHRRDPLLQILYIIRVCITPPDLLRLRPQQSHLHLLWQSAQANSEIMAI